MLKTSEFLALSRWGQVPVLADNGRIYTQSAAIVEHLAETLVRFQGRDLATAIRNGSGMSMPYFRQSFTAMRFSLANDNFFQSLSSL
jgi:glutathione S-transferase